VFSCVDRLLLFRCPEPHPSRCPQCWRHQRLQANRCSGRTLMVVGFLWPYPRRKTCQIFPQHRLHRALRLFPRLLVSVLWLDSQQAKPHQKSSSPEAHWQAFAGTVPRKSARKFAAFRFLKGVYLGAQWRWRRAQLTVIIGWRANTSSRGANSRALLLGEESRPSRNHECLSTFLFT